MTDLEEVRKHWLEECPRYEEYGALIAARLDTALKATGVWFEISHRPKSIDSLIRKLIKKPNHTYESIPDKSGVRVIVRYRADLDLIIPIISQTLHCGPIERKLNTTDTVGYLSVHVDWVRLQGSDPEQRGFPVERFWAELQLRTQAQHLWSEMSHDSIYKNESTIATLSDDIKRRVNLMAGQIEVADREFDRLAVETRASNEAQLLGFLEQFFYRLTSAKFDIELSLMILKVLIPLFKEDLPAIKAEMQQFLEAKKDFLEQRYSMAQEQGATPVSPIFFQPEALLLYERLSKDEVGLRKAWNETLPPKELEKLAKDLGFSFQ